MKGSATAKAAVLALAVLATAVLAVDRRCVASRPIAPHAATTDRDMFLAAVRAGLGRLGAHIGSVGDQPDLFRADMLAFHASVLGPPS